MSAEGEGGPRRPVQGWLLDEPTIGEVVEWYITNIVEPNPRKGTRKTYTWVLRWWVREMAARNVERPCGPDLAEAMAREVKRHMASDGTEGAGASTMNMRRRILGRCYHVARSKWRLLPDL